MATAEVCLKTKVSPEGGEQRAGACPCQCCGEEVNLGIPPSLCFWLGEDEFFFFNLQSVLVLKIVSTPLSSLFEANTVPLNGIPSPSITPLSKGSLMQSQEGGREHTLHQARADSARLPQQGAGRMGCSWRRMDFAADCLSVLEWNAKPRILMVLFKILA